MWLNPWPFRIHVQVESNFMFSESDDDIPINSNLHGQSSKLTIFDWNWISMKTKIVIYHEIETNLTRIIFILTPTIMVSFKFYFKKRSKFRILSYMKETIIAKFRWEKVEIGDHVSNWNFSEFWMDRKWIKIWVPWIPEKSPSNAFCTKISTLPYRFWKRTKFWRGWFKISIEGFLKA